MKRAGTVDPDAEFEGNVQYEHYFRGDKRQRQSPNDFDTSSESPKIQSQRKTNQPQPFLVAGMNKDFDFSGKIKENLLLQPELSKVNKKCELKDRVLRKNYLEDKAKRMDEQYKEIHDVQSYSQVSYEQRPIRDVKRRLEETVKKNMI